MENKEKIKDPEYSTIGDLEFVESLITFIENKINEIREETAPYYGKLDSVSIGIILICNLTIRHYERCIDAIKKNIS
ncbi:MAG TPA: hypothetical protein PK495_08390 [Bacteroidales bacterium]|nr:hypothetical protein [Bacteroidales bacterium]